MTTLFKRSVCLFVPTTNLSFILSVHCEATMESCIDVSSYTIYSQLSTSFVTVFIFKFPGNPEEKTKRATFTHQDKLDKETRRLVVLEIMEWSRYDESPTNIQEGRENPPSHVF